MACDSYLMVLIEVFMNHILAENIFHEAHRENRTQDYGLITRQ